MPRGQCGGPGVGVTGALTSGSNNNSSVLNNNNNNNNSMVQGLGATGSAMGTAGAAGMFGAMGHMSMPYAMSMPPMRPLGAMGAAMGVPPQYASHLNQLSINVNTHSQLPFAFHGAGAHQSWDDGVPIYFRFLFSTRVL